MQYENYMHKKDRKEIDQSIIASSISISYVDLWIF